MIAEIAYGIKRLARSKRRDALASRFELLKGEIRRALWSDEVSESFGAVNIEDFDAAIAAHALAAGCILVTSNLKHMTRVPGLHVEDWSQKIETTSFARTWRLEFGACDLRNKKPQCGEKGNTAEYASELHMKRFLSQPFFAVAGRIFTGKDALIAAYLSGELAILRSEVAARLSLWNRRDPEAILDEQSVEAAAEEFRHERNLLTAEDMEEWLTKRETTIDEWMDAFRRAALSETGTDHGIDGIANADPISEEEIDRHLLHRRAGFRSRWSLDQYRSPDGPACQRSSPAIRSRTVPTRVQTGVIAMHNARPSPANSTESPPPRSIRSPLFLPARNDIDKARSRRR